MSILVVRLTDGFDAAGVYSLAVSVYGIFSSVGQYRMYTYQISDVNGENTTGEYVAFRIVTNSISLVLCMGYALLTCPASALMSILLYAIYKAIALLIDVLHACDQRNHRMDYMGQSLALQGVVSIVLFATVFYLFKNLELALLFMSVGIVVVGICFDIPRTRKLDSLRPSISVNKTLFLLKRCFSIVLAGIAASAAPSIPRQVLSILIGSAALGAYSSVAAPVAIIQMGASYIYNPLLGYFSERYANNDRRGFFRLFRKSSIAILLLAIVCSIGISLFGRPVLMLVFGEGIAEYTYLLQPLVLLAFLTGYSWFINDLLIAMRNFRGTFVGSVSSCIVALALCVPLIDRFGMNGVTYTGLLATVVSTVVMLCFMCKQLRLRWA